jgi:hypothetical protein
MILENSTPNFRGLAKYIFVRNNLTFRVCKTCMFSIEKLSLTLGTGSHTQKKHKTCLCSSN